ncbi:MAG: TetR/AcrR family transcriptional regulator [Myxococcota bacterium]
MLRDPTAGPQRTQGERRRYQILECAVDLASAVGLSGLSIGRLARELGASKTGVYAHFGSKQALQLATIEHASVDFERQVLQETREEEPGLPRLRARIAAWLRYVEQIPCRGGCFFAATSSEFASRPGPVRERLAERTGTWLRALEREARIALRQGELCEGADPATLAFSIHACVQEANWARELLGADEAFARARACIELSLATALAPRAAEPRPHPTKETPDA